MIPAKRGTSQNNYQKGATSLVVLALLKRGDMYGYDMVREFEEASDGCLTTQEGSLYQVLYRLADAGYISGKSVLVGKRMSRIYYHLEPKGEEHLKKLAKDYTRVSEGVFRIIELGKKAKAEREAAEEEADGEDA